MGAGCCRQVAFFYIQNKRSGGTLTAGTFERLALTIVLRLRGAGQNAMAGFNSLGRLAARLRAAVCVLCGGLLCPSLP